MEEGKLKVTGEFDNYEMTKKLKKICKHIAIIAAEPIREPEQNRNPVTRREPNREPEQNRARVTRREPSREPEPNRAPVARRESRPRTQSRRPYLTLVLREFEAKTLMVVSSCN